MSSQLANIHDGFFKYTFSDLKRADTFLREHLPPEVACLLGAESPEAIPGPGSALAAIALRGSSPGPLV
jgi:hypothetical protein